MLFRSTELTPNGEPGSIDTVVGSTDPFSHSPFLVLDGARRALKDESLPVCYLYVA